MSNNRARTLLTILALFFFVAGAGCTERAKPTLLTEKGVFTDQAGKTVRLSDYKGKVLLMNFFLIECPHGGCKLMSMHFLRVQLHLKDRLGKDFFLVSVAIDPEGTTQEALKAYSNRYKADTAGWHFLTADKLTVDKLQKNYDVRWKTDPDGSRHHRVVMALHDREGKKIKVYDDLEYDTKKIIDDIKRLLDPNAKET